MQIHTHVKLLAAFAVAMLLAGTVWAQNVDRAITDGFRDWNAAMAKENAEGASMIWAENGVRQHPLAGELRGRIAQRDFYAALLKDFSDQKITETWRAVQSPRAAVEFTWTATHRASNKSVRVPMLVSFEYDRQGKIANAHQYFDTAAFFKQLE